MNEEEVSCADRNCTRMQGHLQALSHAALPGNSRRRSRVTRVTQPQYDLEQAFTSCCCSSGPSSLHSLPLHN